MDLYHWRSLPTSADLTEIEPIRHIVTEGIGEYPRERHGRIEIAVAIRVQGGEPVVTSRQIQEHLVLPSEVRCSVYGVHPVFRIVLLRSFIAEIIYRPQSIDDKRTASIRRIEHLVDRTLTVTAQRGANRPVAPPY